MISKLQANDDPVISREEAIAILNTPDEQLDELIVHAEKLRRKYKGNHVSIHILTNARSGNCSQDCAYCAQSCRSIGFLTEKQALMLKDAGLDRINHNLNSSRSYYKNICTTHTFEQRVENIRMLQRLGFEICSGGIIGMGESKEDVVDMLLELREIQPEALPINFLLPIPGTPLENADLSTLTPSYCMKVLCLARLLLPDTLLQVARESKIRLK